MVGELSNNIRNFDRERMHLFDEKNAFDALIEDGMFPFYSNSYMVVIGEEPEVSYSKFSNDRSPNKAIKTELILENGEKKLRKYASDEKSAEHIRNIYASYQMLSKRYEGSKLEINHCKLVDGEIPYVELEYVEGITLAEMLDEYLKKGDDQGFKNLFKEYVERIRYGEEHEVTDYDMIFANILVNQDKWTVIDYEWTFPKRTDIKEIAFRSIYCYLLENGKRNSCDKEWMFNYLGIKPEEVDDYCKKESLFQEYVMEGRKSMAQLILEIGGKVIDVDRLRRKQGTRQIQVYQDKGEGYKIENLSYVQGTALNEQDIKFEMGFGKNVRNLRIDPTDDPCICKIKEVKINDVNIAKEYPQLLSVNGSKIGETIIFATSDPNIYIQMGDLSLEEKNIFSITMACTIMSMEVCEDLSRDVKTKDARQMEERPENKLKRKMRLWLQK